MARRRMFSLDIVDTDAFLDMPSSAQNLYFALGMRADDEGFVSSPKRITALVSSSTDDYKLLVAKRLIIPFETGVCVVRDWKVNNYIQSDRRKETLHTAEKAQLLTNSTGSYALMDFGEPIIRREPGKLPEIVTPCRERAVWEIDALPGVTFETQQAAIEAVRYLRGA